MTVFWFGFGLGYATSTFVACGLLWYGTKGRANR